MASLNGLHEVVLVITSDGVMAADVRPLVRVNVSVIAEQSGRREQGFSGGGGRFGLNEITLERCLGHAREAVRQALVNLEAVSAPAGTMPVVLGPGWPGVLLHEAIGHGLEGDFNRKGTSAFTDASGSVSPPNFALSSTMGPWRHVVARSISTMKGRPTRCTTLIEKGVLRGYLQDKLNARLMGMQPTGNGRRESFAHVVMPRMTNTYMLAGPHDPDEIIRSVKKGLYAVNFGGGQVDITSASSCSRRARRT